MRYFLLLFIVFILAACGAPIHKTITPELQSKMLQDLKEGKLVLNSQSVNSDLSYTWFSNDISNAYNSQNWKKLAELVMGRCLPAGNDSAGGLDSPDATGSGLPCRDLGANGRTRRFGCCSRAAQSIFLAAGHAGHDAGHCRVTRNDGRRGSTYPAGRLIGPGVV